VAPRVQLRQGDHRAGDLGVGMVGGEQSGNGVRARGSPGKPGRFRRPRPDGGVAVGQQSPQGPVVRDSRRQHGRFAADLDGLVGHGLRQGPADVNRRRGS